MRAWTTSLTFRNRSGLSGPQYVKLRDEADRLAKLWGDSEAGQAMAKQRSLTEAAIMNLDAALRAYDGKSN
jgi:hypothetical protein